MRTPSTHPKALPFLFLTEMWERFGFYVVQGMLVLYMSKAFGFSDKDSYTIMGVFSALAYIAPFIGGTIADRLLGFKTAIFWGGIFLCTGYAMLASPWENGFYFSLATIIVGNGLFKPNISSLLGSLYAPGDPHRESGFTIFYVGINLGVLLAGFSSGYVKDHFGWHAGFALASIGLIFGLIIFGVGLKKIARLPLHVIDLGKPSTALQTKVIFGSVVAIGLISLLLRSTLLAKWFLPIMGVVLLVFLLGLASKQNTTDRRRLLTLITLILSSIIFWMLFLQIFFSANLFIDRLVNKHIGSFTIPTTVFYALESVFVILLGPVFAWSWQTLSHSNKNPSAFMKFIFAIAFASLGFFILGMSTHFPDANNLINPLWVVVSYFFITVGELLLSPIGLSAVTTLAPRQLVGMMMGVWFVATGFGGQFAGWLAQLSNVPENIVSLDAQLAIYHNAFMDFAYIAFGVAVGLFVVYLFLKNFFGKESSF